jgi:RNA polymerase sigma-70 factor (ECF subfamily)
MSEYDSFAEFIRRIRAGDDQAARELVERYEPVIRRGTRLRLRDPRLASRFDWADVCQSVMASFFARAAAGQFDLDRPEQLLWLLVVMTQNKVTQQVRRNSAGRRDYRRLEVQDPAYLEGRGAASPSPSRVVAGRDLLDEFRRRLSEEERRLADLRAQGCDWAEISAEVGPNPTIASPRANWSANISQNGQKTYPFTSRG